MSSLSPQLVVAGLKESCCGFSVSAHHPELSAFQCIPCGSSGEEDRGMAGVRALQLPEPVCSF